MKKFLALLLAVSMIPFAVGCDAGTEDGGDSVDSNTTEETTE